MVNPNGRPSIEMSNVSKRWGSQGAWHLLILENTFDAEKNLSLFFDVLYYTSDYPHNRIDIIRLIMYDPDMADKTEMDSYTKPGEVASPKTRWNLVDVLLDGGEGEASFALGFWDGTATVALRWNGTADSPVGSPSSRGYSSWMILPTSLHAAALEQADIPGPLRIKAKTLLGI
jgi:hypothetical protein